MVVALIWLGVVVLIVAGLAALARERPLSEEDYEERRGKGTALGNAMLALHELLEPRRGEAGKAREERRAEADPGGDPPDTDPEAAPGPSSQGGAPPERS